MTEAQQRTLCREAILMDLESASPASLPLSTLVHGMRAIRSITITKDQAAKHLSHLISKGFAQESSSAISAGDKRYSLTAAGRDFLESEGLV